MRDSLSFSTRSLSPADRFAHYSDFYSSGADAVDLGVPIAADVLAWRLEGLVVYERRIAGLGSERLAGRVRCNQFDHFTLQLNLRGDFHGEGASGFQAVGPGEILLLDMAKPMRTRMPDVHLITLSIPRAAVRSASCAVDQLHGLVIPATSAAPLASFLISLIGRRNGQSQFGRPDDSLVITDLLGAALNRMGLGAPPSDARLNAALRYIRQSLADETLSPTRVARATGLSRATLYRLFEPIGGIGKYIQAQRLERLKSSLADPAEQQPVAALAFDAGFATEQHANRSFKQQFGRPPAEFRREMRRLTASRAGDGLGEPRGKMLSWVLNLNPDAHRPRLVRQFGGARPADSDLVKQVAQRHGR